MSEIKPCPFCGGKAMLHENNREVTCLSCECLGPFKDTGEEAIEAWNSREKEQIVHCRDCAFYHEVVGIVDSSELLVKRCCWYFDTWSNEVQPDGFCKWGRIKKAVNE